MTVIVLSTRVHNGKNNRNYWNLTQRKGHNQATRWVNIRCKWWVSFKCKLTTEPFKPSSRARNLAYEYNFNPNQEFKLTSTTSFYVLGEENDKGDRLKLTLLKDYTNLSEGIITVQAKTEPPSIITLIPDEYVRPDPIPHSIEEVTQEYDSGSLGKSAIVDFLKRDYPRIRGVQPGEPIASSHNPNERLTQIVQAIVDLDDSYLPIQGPPGAGKTFTGKHVIAELLRQGKKVGISSNSHKAINNLLIGTVRYCSDQGIEAFFGCTKDTDDEIQALGIAVLQNKDIANHTDQPCVVGTTAWGFSRDDLQEQFDYLFVDEAGQVSVANLIAMSRATSNIVLMGDQMQLGQPAQGTHPGESGLSTLDYLLHHTPTISEDRGVFLETTYRMHSAVNKFISDAIYEGKLNSHPDNDKQIIEVPQDYKGLLNKEAGVILIPVEHEGNTQASDEEVEAIQLAVNDLFGRVFTDKSGEKRTISWEDMLFVAPYNFQVNKIREALGPDAKVGSVDKFQGQEAPIVFFSMCASDASDSPRGMDFLFDKNRINVAISRAQSLAIIIANPGLTNTAANTIEQQSKLNVFCQLLSNKN
jgi:hypothetical protein